MLTSVAITLDANFVAPTLNFSYNGPPGPGMFLGHINGGNEFTAVQSVDACSGPFTFSATVEGVNPRASNSFDIALVSQDLSETLSIEGVLDPSSPRYGIWAGPTLTPVAGDDLVATPSDNAVDTVEVTVDASGSAAVTVSGAGSGSGQPGQLLGSASGLQVGTDPLYVLLGQRGVAGHWPGPAAPLWRDVSLNASGAPQMGSVTAAVSPATPTVAAVETVPDDAIPISVIANTQSTGTGSSGTDPSSAPLSSISLSSSPLGSIPLSSIPLSVMAMGTNSPDAAIAAAANALSNVALSEVTITYPPGCSGTTCSGWTGVLAGTSLSGLPLQSLSLGQVVGNAVAAGRFGSTGMDLDALGLSSSPLSSVPLSSVPLASVPLSALPLPGTPSTSGSPPSETDVLTTWCATLSNLSTNCDSLGIDPATPSTASTVTLLTLALAGAPLSSIPLSSIPLGSIPLSSIPLSSIPLSSIPLSSSPLASIPLSTIPLSSGPLGSIPLSSIGDLATVVNCAGAFACSGQTLGAAATNGALVPAVTLGQLVSALTDPSGVAGYQTSTLRDILVGDDTTVPGYPDLTLGDLLFSLVSPQSYPWQTGDLAGAPLAQHESAGGSDRFTVPLQITGGNATVELTVTLPPTFAYVAGSSTLDGAPTPEPATTEPAATEPAATEPAVPEPAAPEPAAMAQLTWSLPLNEGAHTFSFAANAGIYLGPAITSVTASTGSSSSTASTTVTVTDGEEPDSTLATATPLAPNTLNLGFMTSAMDINDWSVTVNQGQELALALTNLPAQYDLELFSPAQQQLQGSPSQQLPAVDDTVPSLSPGNTVEATPGAQDIPVTPPAGYQLYALANVPAAASGLDGANAGAQYIQTPPLDAGTYVVQVSGYNGATSSQPYLLRAALAGGGPSPSCPPLNFPHPEPPPSSSLPAVARERQHPVPGRHPEAQRRIRRRGRGDGYERRGGGRE